MLAARDWVAWEEAILSLEEEYEVPDPRQQMRGPGSHLPAS